MLVLDLPRVQSGGGSMSNETLKRSPARFWLARCHWRTKGLMILALAGAFVVQTILVYGDPSQTVLLGEQAIAGRHLWQRNNCQACHQLHGFGGFLGPDLTNASARLERSQLDSLLMVGMGQMPSFDMQPQEIDAIWAFLSAMNETGRGQARNPSLMGLARFGTGGDTPSAVALLKVIAESQNDLVAEGFEVFRTRTCQTCHFLYARSSVGAPDLSISGGLLSPDEIMAVLENGRPPKMLPPVLSAAERERVQAFIVFLAEHRTEAMARVTREPGSFWSSLPWWEY